MYSEKKRYSFSLLDHRSTSAFTLIELLVVISIIAILAGITFGISSAVQDSQARSRAKAEISILSQALDQFKSKNGDFPWTTSGYTSSDDSVTQNNGEELFLALAGWKHFKKGATVTFDTKLPSDVPSRGPEAYIEPLKLTYAEVSDLRNGIIEEYNPPLENLNTVAPEGHVFVDPWGNPYVYVYQKEAGSGWDNFGYVLYSKGEDGKDLALGSDGVITDTIRNDTLNADNIYVGE